MSLQVRRHLQQSLIFQNPVGQRYQLAEIDPETGRFVLDTWLVNAMDEMQGLGIEFEVTALRDDHRIDSCLGSEGHNPAGKAMDFWFLASHIPGDYLSVKDHRFSVYLDRLTQVSHVTGIGLGGESNVPDLLSILGPRGFGDNGSDHIHLQV